MWSRSPAPGWEFPGSRLVNRGNVWVFAKAQRCSYFWPTRGEMVRLSRHIATACKFPAHKNYAVTQVSAAGFEPGTVRLRVQRAATEPCRSHVECTILFFCESAQRKSVESAAIHHVYVTRANKCLQRWEADKYRVRCAIDGCDSNRTKKRHHHSSIIFISQLHRTNIGNPIENAASHPGNGLIICCQTHRHTSALFTFLSECVFVQCYRRRRHEMIFLFI